MSLRSINDSIIIIIIIIIKYSTCTVQVSFQY